MGPVSRARSVGSLCSLTLSVVIFASVVAGAGSQAFGQDAPKWLIGKWTGTAPSPIGGGRVDRFEYVFKEGGAFEVEIQSARAGLTYAKGAYKIDGARAILTGVFDRGREFSGNAKQSGDEMLEVEVRSPIDGKYTTASLSRSK